MRASVVIVAALLGIACDGEVADEYGAGPPARRPDPPRFDCALGGPARSFEGRDAALAQNAVVVHDASGRATLHRLDAPTEPALALPDRVLALSHHDGGWVAVTPSRVLQLAPNGDVEWEASFDVEATDAAVTLDALRGWLVLRDAEDEISLHDLDLVAHEVGPATSVGRGRGRLLVAPQRASWVAPGATTHLEAGASPVAGRAVALVGDQVLYTAPDRTGIWVGEDHPVRVTRGDASAEGTVATGLGSRLVIAYASEGDLFVQPADVAEGALGEPVLVAAAAAPTQIVASGERFWVTWERAPDRVEVRAGECRGD
ncbi:MAG: hypothetical protein H6719_32325 [Sandaracinaceae bacterium]|nr:hypothetical protein [Sandaracinaceae bacterium]